MNACGTFGRRASPGLSHRAPGRALPGRASQERSFPARSRSGDPGRPRCSTAPRGRSVAILALRAATAPGLRHRGAQEPSVGAGDTVSLTLCNLALEAYGRTKSTVEPKDLTVAATLREWRDRRRERRRARKARDAETIAAERGAPSTGSARRDVDMNSDQYRLEVAWPELPTA